LGAGLLPCSNLKQGYVLIGPDGNLYTCLNHLCREELAIGDVSNGLYGNELLRFFKTDPLPEECSACNLFPACSGLCPDNRRNSILTCSKDAVLYRLKTQFYLAMISRGILSAEVMGE